MKSPQERGRYGRWLVASREARGFSSTVEARRAMEAAGIVIGHSTYAEYEAGTKPPSKNHLPLLERFWGPVDLFEAQALDPDPSLAAAITLLVAELRAGREEREALEARLRAVEAELQSLRGPRAGGASPARSSRLGSVG
jgi:hypothetical protein